VDTALLTKGVSGGRSSNEVGSQELFALSQHKVLCFHTRSWKRNLARSCLDPQGSWCCDLMKESETAVQYLCKKTKTNINK
jgi:hypothetical protein